MLELGGLSQFPKNSIVKVLLFPVFIDCQDVYDNFANNLTQRISALADRRVWRQQSADWQRAYYNFGRGSTLVRADIIGNEIYQKAAPIPDVIPLPDRNQFLREVIAEVKAAAEEVGVQLL